MSLMLGTLDVSVVTGWKPCSGPNSTGEKYTHAQRKGCFNGGDSVFTGGSPKGLRTFELHAVFCWLSSSFPSYFHAT